MEEVEFDYQQQESDDRRRQEPGEIRRLTRLAYSQPEEAGRQAKALGLYEPMLQHMLRASRFFTFRSKHGR